jgi:hypothetical protein
MSTEENAAPETIRSKMRRADEDQTPSRPENNGARNRMRLRRALETTASEASRKSMTGEQTDKIRKPRTEICRTLARVNQEDKNGAGRSQPKPRETQHQRTNQKFLYGKQHRPCRSVETRCSTRDPTPGYGKQRT